MQVRFNLPTPLEYEEDIKGEWETFIINNAKIYSPTLQLIENCNALIIKRSAIIALNAF